MRTISTSHKSEVPLWILLKEQTGIIVLGVLFLMGVASGAAVTSLLNEELAENLLSIMGGFVKNRADQSITLTFLSALMPNLLLLGMAVLCGFCAVGAPIILLLPWFKGLGFGLSASCILVCYGYRSWGYIALLLLPNIIISTVALLQGCREALTVSLSLYRCVSSTQRAETPIKTGGFTARCILLALVMALGAAIESYFFIKAGGLFL